MYIYFSDHPLDFSHTKWTDSLIQLIYEAISVNWGTIYTEWSNVDPANIKATTSNIPENQWTWCCNGHYWGYWIVTL